MRVGKRQALAGGPTLRGRLDLTSLPSEKLPLLETGPGPAHSTAKGKQGRGLVGPGGRGPTEASGQL